MLAVLLPELSTLLDDSDADDGATARVFRVLAAIDRHTQARGAPLDDVVLATLLLLEPMKEACAGARDRVSAAYQFLDPVIERLAMPRRMADAMRRIVAVLRRAESRHGNAIRRVITKRAPNQNLSASDAFSTRFRCVLLLFVVFGIIVLCCCLVKQTTVIGVVVIVCCFVVFGCVLLLIKNKLGGRNNQIINY